MTLNRTPDRDWSLPCEWFAEAAHKLDQGDVAAAAFAERVGMGGVEGSYEHLRVVNGEQP